MNRYYLVYTIDALDLIYNQNLNLINTSSSYKLDLSKYISESIRMESIDERAIFHQMYLPESVHLEKHDDCALFHQMCLLSGHDFSQGEPSHDILLKKIIIVDFEHVFAKMSLEKYSIEKLTEEIKKPKESASWGSHLSKLLDSKKGISIRFSKNESFFSFIPFDKSASMAKKCRITYIEKNIKDDLDKRLCLDIDFSNITLSLSKYYAYRGLYLTSGVRVEMDDHPLNEKTLIVLPDVELHPTSDYDGTPLVYTQKNASIDNTELYEFEVRNEAIPVTAFDGEGLVAPLYANLFRNAVNSHCHCFQIRLPWMKGMLFSDRDFHEFFKDKCKSKDPIIKDYLGIERHLNDAQIIVCQSVFKCHEWLKQFCSNNSELIRSKFDGDPMKYYFSKVNEYQHSIYISGSDASFFPDGYEKLNYQFLDSMKLSHEDMYKLVKEHTSIAADQLHQYIRPDQNPFDPYAIYNSKPYIEAACRNPAFNSEERLWDDVLQQMRNTRLDCGMGTLYTQGEHRFLSGDLVAYLWYIAGLSDGLDPKTDNFDEYFAGKNLLSGKFYMPVPKENGFHFVENKYYAIFRSPHLSRNEECVLRAHIPSSESDLYKKYFGEIAGILMVPIDSLVQNICSGADFDGDHVKVYSDDTIVNAVISGGYDSNGKRILPVVNIPVATPVKETPTDETAFKELLVNTFSNFTGKISNLSVRFADKEYRYSAPAIPPENSLCAQTTAVTGLEIDAVKNNGHPRKNIEALEKKKGAYGKGGEQFIKCKNAFKSVRGSSYKKVVQSSNGNYLFKYSPSEPSITIRKPHNDDHSIMLLPYLFAEYDCNARDKELLKNRKYLPIVNNGIKHFTFEGTNNGKIDLNILDKVKKLISAYLDLNKDIREYNKDLLMVSKSYPKLITLLSLKYDSMDEKLPYRKDEKVYRLDATVEQALQKSIKLINNHLKYSQNANDAIKKAKDKWLLSTDKKRLTVFRSILNMTSDETVSDEVQALLFDFSNSGYYILYYILEMLYSAYLLNEKKAENLKQWRKKSKNNEYYSELLEAYSKMPKIIESPDQASTENADISEADASPFQGWKEILNNMCYNKLKEIVSDDQTIKNSASETINTAKDLAALKYAWFSRNDVDKRGTFFWDVIPREVIMQNIQED